MAVETSEAFQKAAADCKKLVSKPDNDSLLSLYALYKVGNGEDIGKAPAPGMFDLKGKAKKNAWQDEVDKGTTPELAQQSYIELVEELKEKLGYDENKVPEAVGA